MSTYTDPLIGRQLGSYRIERVLGRGGMAVVYYATDVQLRRPAAVKVIDATFRGDTGYAERFIAEARMVAAWRHENILQIYHAGEQDGLYYFAMEYIDGQDLATLLAEAARQGERIPQDEVLRVGRAVAAALDYAHARGVVHRDVKPSNILVAKDGRIVLGDFGLAMDVSQGSFGEVFGSAQYIAPEQARRSNAAVPQSDLYALGVVLYEMLAGRVPFDDPSPASVALQHLTQPVPSPRQANPDLNEAVAQVLLRALAKAPDQRYPSGAALMQALDEALTSAAKTTPARPLALSALLRPRVLIPAAAVFLVAILAVVLLSGLSLLRRINARPTADPTAALASGPLEASGPLSSATVVLASADARQSPPAPTQPPDLTLTASPAVATATTVAATTVATSLPPGSLPNPTPSWTPRYASGRHMLLFWNETSFYLLQTSGYGEMIEPVVFERLDAGGLATNRFTGRLWAEYTPTSLRDFCYRLLVGGPKNPPGGVAYLEPPQCHQAYLATRYPPAGDAMIFWTSQPGTTIFRVLWGHEEVQRCAISAGTCEVYLP